MILLISLFLHSWLEDIIGNDEGKDPHQSNKSTFVPVQSKNRKHLGNDKASKQNSNILIENKALAT